MSDGQRYAKVPATLGRAGWQRHAEHTAETGQLKAYGSSQAAALAGLGEQLAAMASRASEEPSVWWDADNGSLWVAYPDAVDGGYRAVRVDMSAGSPGSVYQGASGQGPAGDAFATALGLARVK